MSKEIKLPPLVPGTREQNDLWDHVYGSTHTSEGVHERLEKVCKAYTIQAIEADRAERQGEAVHITWDAKGNRLVNGVVDTQQEQEHVATVQCVRGVTIGYLEKMLPVGTKLYTEHGIGGEK